MAGHREQQQSSQTSFDFIFFTGSTSTGKVIARAAAENFDAILLELGGQTRPLWMKLQFA